MSTIKVNNLSGKGGATPNLPDGAVISGVATVTNLKPTNVNVSGAVTATTFDGSLKSTGTPTLGLGVTINSSGVHISGVTTVGVVTGGTFYGDGSNLAGVGETIAPWHYNPPLNGIDSPLTTGIGITFNKAIYNGSGTITAKVVNVASGAAGTTKQSWGISSVTKGVTDFTLNSVASLGGDNTIQITIPDGFFVDSNETSYVGTAWTFNTAEPVNKLFTWGDNRYGVLGLNDTTHRSSPTQIPGLTWAEPATSYGGIVAQRGAAIRTDGTLWVWGTNQAGAFGTNQSYIQRSSPVQVPGTTWSDISFGDEFNVAVKTDGTLWSWGNQGGNGVLGLNNAVQYSSPVQIPGTTWATGRRKIAAGYNNAAAIRTDGTLWTWGNNGHGALGHNEAPSSRPRYSSPTQIPGTTWKSVKAGYYYMLATKTDGTLWSWGYNTQGQGGVNNANDGHSSPTQVPGTSWAEPEIGNLSSYATRTDGTLWAFGENAAGSLGINIEGSPGRRSSPTQIPGTWSTTGLHGHAYAVLAVKANGTLWAWGDAGNDAYGLLGQNQPQTSQYSSPVQIGSETDWHTTVGAAYKTAIQADETP